MLTHDEETKVKLAVVEGCDSHMKRLQAQRDALCAERRILEEEIAVRRMRLLDVDADICKIGLEMQKCREVKQITQKLLDNNHPMPDLVMQEVGA